MCWIDSDHTIIGWEIQKYSIIWIQTRNTVRFLRFAEYFSLLIRSANRLFQFECSKFSLTKLFDSNLWEVIESLNSSEILVIQVILFNSCFMNKIGKKYLIEDRKYVIPLRRILIETGKQRLYDDGN